MIYSSKVVWKDTVWSYLNLLKLNLFLLEMKIPHDVS